ncbi:acetyltransferase [Candidatus Bathyarchaeota archaeon]|nr:acetyltransferase [Candidatus Bathyarchaeota archaeon]
MDRDIVIIGAGGFGKEVLDVLEASGLGDMFAGFVDDDEKLWGKRIRGHTVLGSMDWFVSGGGSCRCIIGIGDAAIRKKIAERLKEAGFGFVNAIHPNVVYTDYVSFGEGVFIGAGCVLTNEIKVGNHVLLNLNVTVGHDTVIGDYTCIQPGCNISGFNEIGEAVYIGTGACTIDYIKIGRGSIIGAGAAVVRDIPENVVAVGIPARVIREIEEKEK